LQITNLSHQSTQISVIVVKLAEKFGQNKLITKILERILFK